MSRSFLLTALLLCGFSFCTPAQVQTSVYLGTGYAYAAVTKGQVSNNFTLGPHLTLLLHMPVGKRGIGIETGCSYTLKGFTNQDTLKDEDENGYMAYRIRSRLGYLGFPLMLTYSYRINSKHRLWAGAGMVYSFMIRGKTQGTYHIVRKDRISDKNEFTLPVTPKLMPAGDGSGSPVYLFDAGFKLQLSYVYQGRFGLRLFREQSLYSYHTPGSAQSETKLRYTGIALSFGFPRLRQ